MMTLIRRELDMAGISRKIVTPYLLLSVGSLAVAWILGPKMIGWLETEQSCLLIGIVFFIFLNTGVMRNLEQDADNRQQIFLQTLPIEKNRIVNVKFLSIFIISILTFIWTMVLFALNIMINQGEWTQLAISSLFASMFLFINSAMLIGYFIWGRGSSNYIFYGALAIWALSFAATSILSHTSITSLFQVVSLALGISALIYIIAWICIFLRVKRAGLPNEF